MTIFIARRNWDTKSGSRRGRPVRSEWHPRVHGSARVEACECEDDHAAYSNSRAQRPDNHSIIRVEQHLHKSPLHDPANASGFSDGARFEGWARRTSRASDSARRDAKAGQRRPGQPVSQIATSATAGGGRPTEPATRPPRRAKDVDCRTSSSAFPASETECFSWLLLPGESSSRSVTGAAVVLLSSRVDSSALRRLLMGGFPTRQQCLVRLG